MSVSPATVILRNVTKRFGEFTAVSDLSLDVRAGRIFGLLVQTEPARPRRFG